MTYIGFDTQNFTKINDNIWIYKNFLSYDQCNSVIEKINNGTVDKVTNNGAKQIMFDTEYIKKRINQLIEPRSYIGGILGYDTPVNVFWLPHTDLDADSGGPYEKQWGIVGYLNNFQGGELLFPYYGIVIKPNAGDLVIHRASNFHSVALTKSHQRLTYTAEILTINQSLGKEDAQKAIDFLVN